MQKLIHLLLILSLSNNMLFCQKKTLKEKAWEEFRNEHYDEAIQLLEQAVIQTPHDPEIYYYLGWFNHYRAYDSRPLQGYDYSYSERIFHYLDKAIELNPNYGDAKYFYGAECSGNAFLAMQNYDVEKVTYFFKRAYKKGAYPDWLIEFGKNFLMSCDKDAILLTGGNADFDICSYLQLCENYRTDITVIPIGNIDRPWYVGLLKNGLNNGIRSIHINLTPQQIIDIHPFKWKGTEISIPISPTDRARYDLKEDFSMLWTVHPDLQSERMHAKTEDEAAQKRTYLSPQRAILLQIIEDNFSRRPIYFSAFAEPSFFGELDHFFQNCGLVSRLTPIKTTGTPHNFDQKKIQQLLTPKNLEKYHDIQKNNIPRISRMIMYGYANATLNLSDLYKEEKNVQGIKNLIKLYTDYLKIDFDTEYEISVIEELKRQLEVI